MGIAAGEMQNDAAHGEDHPRGDLEELESNGGDLSASQFGADESHAPQVFDEHVGGGGQQQPQLIGQNKFCPVVAFRSLSLLESLSTRTLHRD